MKRLILYLIILSVASCQTSVHTFLPQRPVLYQSLNKQQTSIAPIVKQLYQKYLADDMISLEELDEISQELERQGISLFKTLHENPSLRQMAYPLSEEQLVNEFTKPSKPDKVPAINVQEENKLRAVLQPGDVILCGNDGSFVHAMLYIGNNQVIHSLATQPGTQRKLWGVVKESLSTYFKRSERDTFVVLRPRQASAADIRKSIQYAHDQIGKGYDSLFLLNLADRFYCTELVYHALRAMSRSPRVYPHKVKMGWSMVTVEDFMDSPDFQTVWERNFKRPSVGRLHRY